MVFRTDDADSVQREVKLDPGTTWRNELKMVKDVSVNLKKVSA